MLIKFEIPVFNAESALRAAQAGADRLELCSSFPTGGETPGVGMLGWVKEKVKIPVFVMIRPRGGDFVYSSDEIEIMRGEIHALGAAGADGFVFGILNGNHTVNTDACRELIKSAGGKPCTFHRAFDETGNAEESLESVMDCGFQRVLTSGLKETMDQGLDTVMGLLGRAGNRIIIMPGGGLKPEHLPQLMQSGRLREIHASCKSLHGNGVVPLFNSDLFDRFRRAMNP
jgi:copper homeostasis protein